MAKKTVMQEHHLAYEPEVKGKLYKGEHWILCQLLRRKKISVWFVKCLGVWILLNGDKADELD